MTRTGILKPLPTWRSGITESGLPSPARHVALTLSLHMNERGGSAYPSLATLAEETGLHKETVHKYLGLLEETGWLAVTRGNEGRGGRNHVNEYRVTWPKRSATPTVLPHDPETAYETDRSSANVQVTGPLDQPERSTSPTDEERSVSPTVVEEETVGLVGDNGRSEPKQRSAAIRPEDVELEDVQRGSTNLAAPRPRNVAFDALAQATGKDPRLLTKPAAQEVGTALAAIRDSERLRLGHDPSREELAQEIHDRARVYDRSYDFRITPSALAKWWDECDPRHPGSRRMSEFERRAAEILGADEVRVLPAGRAP